MGLFSPNKNKNKPKNNTIKNTNMNSSKRYHSETSPGASTSSSHVQDTKIIKTAKEQTSRTRSPFAQRRMPDYWLSTHNRFSELSKDADETVTQEEKNINLKEKNSNAIPKPPPLFIFGVDEIKPLVTELEKKVEQRYSLKVLNDKKVKILLESKADYQTVTSMLDEKKTEYHCFQPKDDKAFRVVLKGLHPKMDTNEIGEVLKVDGHEVLSISVVRSRKTGRDLSMFFVNLKKKDNNKMIYKINRLLNMVVSVEAPHTIKYNVLQCERCQRFGHTKNYCHLGARCVKCTGSHPTSECLRKAKDDNVKCINCGGNHPANYRGCEVYQKLRQKLYPALRQKIAEKVNTERYTNPNISYADQLKNSGNSDQPETHSNDMAELKDMMKNLMTQMSTMLNLLTTVVSKLK